LLSRFFIIFVLLIAATTAVPQSTCFDAANQYRAKYLEQTSIDFDTLGYHLKKGDNLLVGCMFPVDTFITLKNQQNTTQDYKGKVLIVNFWSIHCAPCVNEIASFHALQKKFAKLAVVAATLDNKEELKAWLKKHPFKGDIVPEAVSFVHRYSLGNGYPFTIVVDPKGKIIYTHSGGETGKEHQMDLYKELDPIVEKALKEE
jgi:thiol-disulfide isomerase/thioredoxin